MTTSISRGRHARLRAPANPAPATTPSSDSRDPARGRKIPERPTHQARITVRAHGKTASEASGRRIQEGVCQERETPSAR